MKEPPKSYPLKAIFKYLSQFQHYSPKTQDFLLTNIEYDVIVYNRCLSEILYMFYMFLQFIEVDEADNFPEKYDRLIKEISN